MATTMEQLRAWRGPALFSYGFRPFFFSGAVLAALLQRLEAPERIVQLLATGAVEIDRPEDGPHPGEKLDARRFAHEPS